jgi:Rps23 Pro-64 3,4-dihydroxylase Tpa1-like proline 4-hydroxylase
MQPIFQDPRYRDMADKLRSTYVSNDPFPHIVIEDFLPLDVAEKILSEFPGEKAQEWHRFDNPMEKKLATREDEQFGPFTREVMHELNSRGFLEFLEKLTGIDALIPDPHFEGGGLHQIPRGGFLKIHADFNYHARYMLNRRLNLLLYMNKGWEDAWKGHLELWDRGMKGCVKKVAPVFNRCVIFSTTDDAYHGHPHALECPEGTTRKSLALYYYTNGHPESGGAARHTTLFRRTPDEIGGPLARVWYGFRWRLAKLLRKLSHAAEPERKTIKNRAERPVDAPR